MTEMGDKDMQDYVFVALDTVFTACHETAVSKGWWEEYGGNDLTPDQILSKLALIHSEVSEATESVRNGERLLWFREDGKPEGVLAELADVVIRCADLGKYLSDDEMCEQLAWVIRLKMEFNKTRPYKHGKVV